MAETTISKFNQILEYLSELESLADVAPRVGFDLCALLGKQYQFSRFIARGGEAVIVLAEDTNCSRSVILKIARPHLNKKPVRAIFNYGISRFKKQETANEFAERFRRGFVFQQVCHQVVTDETFALGYVPAVFRIEDAPGLFCEMEYIPGEMLLDWAINQDKIEILRMFLRIVTFVELTLHNHGFVHSDLKHDNWLVLGDGRPVLLDFNIAKNLAQASALTTHRTQLGSRLYSSPKQLRSSHLRDYRDDIWTLGLTLHVIWRGHEPHTSAFIGDLIDVRKMFPQEILPVNVAQIFLKCTAEDDGYTDISDLRSDIEYILAHEYATAVKVKSAPSVDLHELFAKLDKLSDDNAFKAFVRAVWEAEELRKNL